MYKSLAVQLPLALKGFAQLKPHASSWQYSHKDVKSEGGGCYGLGFIKFIYLENRFLNFYNKKWKQKQEDSIKPTQLGLGTKKDFFSIWQLSMCPTCSLTISYLQFLG